MDTVRIEKSITLQDLRRAIEQDPFAVFDRTPIREFRLDCLNKMRLSCPVNSDERAQWAEERIRALIAERDDVWEELMRWYLYEYQEEYGLCYAARAFEFAVRLALDASLFHSHHKLTKMIAGRLREDHRLYWVTSSLRKLLRRMLSATCQRYGGQYSEAEWYDTERAVRAVVGAGDTTLLPVLVDILALHQEGVVRSWDKEDIFAPTLRAALLRTAVQHLEMLRVQEKPDLSAVFGSYLRQQAGLNGAVTVLIGFVLESKDSKLVVQLRPADTKEHEQLRRAAQECWILWEGEGFEEVRSAVSDVRKGEETTGEAIFDDKLCASFLFAPSPGSNRFRLSIHSQEKKDIVSYTDYVIEDE